MLRGLSFNRERLSEAASDEMLAATDVADLLVRRGVPFREAHGIVAGLVRRAVDMLGIREELLRRPVQVAGSPRRNSRSPMATMATDGNRDDVAERSLVGLMLPRLPVICRCPLGAAESVIGVAMRRMLRQKPAKGYHVAARASSQCAESLGCTDRWFYRCLPC